MDVYVSMCMYLFFRFLCDFLWKLILMLGDNITFKNSLAFLNMRDFFLQLGKV